MGGLGLEHLILLPLLVLGLFTIQSDWRFGKIRHEAIRFGLLLGAGWLLILGLADWLSSGTPDFIATRWPAALVATGAALLGGAGMWLGNVWSAADAKLFVVYTLLLPLPFYARSQPAFLAPIVLLVNTYTAAFVVITIDFLLNVSRRGKHFIERRRRQNADERLREREAALAALRALLPGALKSFAGFAAVFLLMRLFRGLVRSPLETYLHLDGTLLFLILFLGFQPLHVLFQKRLAAILFGGGLLVYAGYLLVRDPSFGELYQVVSVGAASLALMAFRALYSYWATIIEVRSIPIADLSAHMILSRATRKTLETTDVFSKEELASFSVEGLSTEQASKVCSHFQSLSEPPATVEIERTIAFAPYLLAGVALSVLAHGPFLKNLLH